MLSGIKISRHFCRPIVPLSLFNSLFHFEFYVNQSSAANQLAIFSAWIDFPFFNGFHGCSIESPVSA